MTDSRFCFEWKKFKTEHHILHWSTRRTKIFCTLTQDNLDDPEKSHVILSLWFFAGLESNELFIHHFKEEVPFSILLKNFLADSPAKITFGVIAFSFWQRGKFSRKVGLPVVYSDRGWPTWVSFPAANIANLSFLPAGSFRMGLDFFPKLRSI